MVRWDGINPELRNAGSGKLKQKTACVGLREGVGLVSTARTDSGGVLSVRHAGGQIGSGWGRVDCRRFGLGEWMALAETAARRREDRQRGSAACQARGQDDSSRQQRTRREDCSRRGLVGICCNAVAAMLLLLLLFSKRITMGRRDSRWMAETPG